MADAPESLTGTWATIAILLLHTVYFIVKELFAFLRSREHIRSSCCYCSADDVSESETEKMDMVEDTMHEKK